MKSEEIKGKAHDRMIEIDRMKTRKITKYERKQSDNIDRRRLTANASFSL